MSWFENIEGTFRDHRILATDPHPFIHPNWSVYGSDLDGDADVDVLSMSTHGTLSWFENTDGRGTFGSEQVISQGRAFTDDSLSDYAFVQAGDVDGDGDVDVLSAYLRWSEPQGRIALHKQGLPQTTAGDANRDIQFNQLDIVQVLQSARYLTGEAATWEEGDWNGDGVFDQEDIVAALQTDDYLQGPYAADALFAAIGG